MEGQDELGVAPKDLSHLVKGKRTKRQRPQSPIPFPTTTHDSSSKDQYRNRYNSSSSAESTTTEEEDTAKCLILLAQGHHFSSKKVGHDDDQDFKFNSKKYIEPGTCVYECKTCNRTFPSFQALGGHRASHKKPKNTTAFVLSDEDHQDSDHVSFRQKNNNINSLSSSPSLQLTNSTIKRTKVHECSYCGAEFTSGQALGGHMRRHRGGLVAKNTTLSLSSPSPASFENQESDELSKKPRNGLSLDLNLPAPEDDPNHTFAFNSKKQQQKGALVLYTPPTLVDCHY
ncbi:C2H2-type zinc finger family protein [Forsythia ovata]|uniref:C2H2-type zinc finger family protein n=1 Tax=Forsythia ovata TaxID=205694 RepID=A0ABD1WYR8_9LAMI